MNRTNNASQILRVIEKLKPIKKTPETEENSGLWYYRHKHRKYMRLYRNFRI